LTLQYFHRPSSFEGDQFFMSSADQFSMSPDTEASARGIVGRGSDAADTRPRIIVAIGTLGHAAD
jgi:hypothetical protein